METELEPPKMKFESTTIDIDAEIDISTSLQIESNLNELFMRAVAQGSVLSVTDDVLEMFQESDEAGIFTLFTK
jgi:hypothetical protein